MATLKRLFIDWFWPDRTTFITKGRRWGIVYLVLAALSFVILVPPILYAFYLVEAKVQPRLEIMIENLGTVAGDADKSTAAEIHNARDWIRESMWFLEWFCFLHVLMLGVIVSALVACGCLLLRAHHALKSGP